MWRVGLFVCFLTCAVTVQAEQELSPAVYPSEDELEEAFINGEIDFIQLVVLQEIIRFGVDSAHLYLLDEIPNLSSFQATTIVERTDFFREQKQGFLAHSPKRDRLFGTITHNYSQRIEDDNVGRYYTSAHIASDGGIESTIRLHREYSGVERIVYRNVRIRPQTGLLKRLIIGNYSTRMGLGTIIGYRGKLLDFSEEIGGESILYPDYGGHNGLHAAFGDSRFSSELMFSSLRDSEFSMTALAGSYRLLSSSLRPQLILVATRLHNRTTAVSIDDFKYGLNWELQYENGFNRAEISAQAGGQSSFGAFVTEGRHRLGDAEIAYAGWIYDDDFLDVTSGSKAGTIRQTVELDEIAFSYSDKHRGQEGGLLKTIVEAAEGIILTNSLVLASMDRENYNLEFMSAIERKFNPSTVLRIDYTGRNRYRTADDKTKSRSRIELRYVNPQVYMRTYLAYNADTDEDDHISLFGNLRYSSSQLGQISLWGNLGKFNHKDGEVNYWYAYIENRQDIFEDVGTIVKFSHRFNRSAAMKHSSTISLGLQVSL